MPRFPSRLRDLARLILKTVTATSLLLFLTTLGLWARASYHSDTIGWAGWRDQPTRLWHGFGLHSQRTHLVAYYFTSRNVRFDDPTNLSGADSEMSPHAFHHVAGDRPATGPRVLVDCIVLPPIVLRFAAAPHWAVAAVLAVAPAWALYRAIIARRQRAPGHCPTCNYDLRATPARCPECGTIPTPCDASPTSS